MFGLRPIAAASMGQLKRMPPTNVLSLRVARVWKGEENSHGEVKANGYRPGAMEPPLPLTPERLELIKAYAKTGLQGAQAPTASQIARRFAPPAQAALPPGERRFPSPTPLAPPLLALASGLRTLAAVLILVALLPNLILGAIFWLRPIDPPSSQQVTPPPGDGHTQAIQSSISTPVLSASATLEATEAETVAFPIALDGTDGVPAGSVIVILGLPEGSALSTGRRRGATGWSLRPDEIGDLHLSLPEGGFGEYQLVSQLVTPKHSLIADAATMLRITPDPRADISTSPIDFKPVETQVSDTPDQEPEVMDIENSSAILEAAASPSDLPPLPTRRPAPSANDDARADWVKPSAYVNLRKSPSSSAPVASVVAKGAKLRVMGRKRGWVQVTNPATSDSGWIYSGNVDAAR